MSSDGAVAGNVNLKKQDLSQLVSKKEKENSIIHSIWLN